MTYLTEVTVGFDTAARLKIKDVYDWHQRLWQCFPGLDGQNRGFLSRLDRRTDCFRVLVVSSLEPVRPDWCTGERQQWRTRAIPESYFTHRSYAFQLCANPTKKISVKGSDGSFTKNGRRVPLRTREELLEWITRKGNQGGFAIDSEALRVVPRGREYFDKKGMQGFHSAVEFQGTLTVNDPARFFETFSRGIGSAKAFGFGLLVIAPIS